jgi:uncharacterized membrane protein
MTRQEAGRIICESSAEIRTQSSNLFLLVEDWDESKALLKPDSPETERINQLLEQLMDITSELDMIGQTLTTHGDNNG